MREQTRRAAQAGTARHGLMNIGKAIDKSSDKLAGNIRKTKKALKSKKLGRSTGWGW